jgi:hypothetical protein
MEYNHRRILRIRLLLIESHLRDTIHKLGSNTDTSNFILYSIKNNIDHESKIRLLGTINSMLDEISQMKEKFALESEEQPIRKKILGRLNEIWTTLEDTRPEKMARGYGSMSKFDEEMLRPHIHKLLSMVDDIYDELGHPTH